MMTLKGLQSYTCMFEGQDHGVDGNLPWRTGFVRFPE